MLSQGRGGLQDSRTDHKVEGQSTPSLQVDVAVACATSEHALRFATKDTYTLTPPDSVTALPVPAASCVPG